MSDFEFVYKHILIDSRDFPLIYYRRISEECMEFMIFNYSLSMISFDHINYALFF